MYTQILNFKDYHRVISQLFLFLNKLLHLFRDSIFSCMKMGTTTEYLSHRYLEYFSVGLLKE